VTRDPMAQIAEELSPEACGARLSLYVALGDSFTAGTGCAPGEAWPERLTAALRSRSPSLELRNLAVEGATSTEVLDQLPVALELEPDLVTVVCGANDVLRSTRPNPRIYGANLATIVMRLREALPGVRVATATSPERWDFLEMGPRTRRRVERGIAGFNRVTREIATALDVECLEVSRDPGLSDERNFSADGLHPSPLGHRQAAEAFAHLLGGGEHDDSHPH
jgi:lysophospholipase L1-like esterase